jgi:uncharacterized protein with PQ loop repeat
MEYVGYVGGTLLGVQLFPQIKKALMTESIKDISRTYLFLNIIGLGCIVSYAVSKDDMPIYIPASVSFLNSVVLYALIQYYTYTNRNTPIIIAYTDPES